MTHSIRRHAEDHRPEGLVDSVADTASQEPSWFLHPANQASREELVARYRKAFNLPDHPPLPSRSASAPRYRDLIGTSPRPPASFLAAHEAVFESRREDLRPAARTRKRTGHTYAIAGLVAVISGGSIGLVVSEYGTLKRQAVALYAELMPIAPTAPAVPQLKTVQATITSKKPVSTATLQVEDVSGQTNSLIPLILHADEPNGADLLLKITGLPPSAYLTSGKRGDGNVWALDLKDLAQVKLMVPESSASHIDLAVAAFEKKTGDLVAPVKTMTVAITNAVVQPASAPPPGLTLAAAAPSSLPGPAGDGQLAAIPDPQSVSVTLDASPENPALQLALRGDNLLKLGNIAAARQSYQQAWEAGAAQGAFGLARSYDPIVLASLKLDQIQPDAKVALLWYTRAADAGLPQASSAIVRLQLKR